MSDKLYNKELKRDVVIAVLLKVFLVMALIFGCKYLKNHEKKHHATADYNTQGTDYPLFSEALKEPENRMG